MAHPRATYPPSIVAHYRQHGGKATAKAYRTGYESLRRWLREHGVEIRPHGLRLGREVSRRVRRIGNSVCPPVAAALVRANLVGGKAVAA